jgi:hypothetical protein
MWRHFYNLLVPYILLHGPYAYLWLAIPVLQPDCLASLRYVLERERQPFSTSIWLGQRYTLPVPSSRRIFRQNGASFLMPPELRSMSMTLFSRAYLDRMGDLLSDGAVRGGSPTSVRA